MADTPSTHLLVRCTMIMYLRAATHERKMRTQMTTLTGRLGSMFATVGAVLDVARSIEARRMPDARALKTLGIEKSSFERIYFR
jgi:hypothetical protein